jgi:hypothetical protein
MQVTNAMTATTARMESQGEQEAAETEPSPLGPAKPRRQNCIYAVEFNNSPTAMADSGRPCEIFAKTD